MIGRANRFHGYGSLRYVYRNGQTVRGPQMSLRYSRNPKRQANRVAVVVSKKINKSAVARNRMRRRIYEAVRQLEVNSEQHDLVITVFQDSVQDLPSAELVSQVRGLAEQAGITKESSKASHGIIETKET